MPRKSEVDQDGPPGIVTADVGWTDVAVDDALAVQVRQRVGKCLRRPEEMSQALRGQSDGERLGERPPSDEVHHKKGAVGEVAGSQYASVDHTNDVRMRKVGQPGELTAQASRCRMRRQELERVLGPPRGILDKVDLAGGPTGESANLSVAPDGRSVSSRGAPRTDNLIDRYQYDEYMFLLYYLQ